MFPAPLRLQRLLFTACASLLFHTALAQQPPAATPPAAAPSAPAPAPALPTFDLSDPKVVKQLETLSHQKYTRDTGEIFQSLEQSAKQDTSGQNIHNRFLQSFRMGDWAKVRSDLAAMPPQTARQIYDKILADLVESRRANVRLEDVLALADAVPGDFTWDEVHRLGQLLGLAVPVNESYWLADRLQRGTEKLGGTDPAKRLLAGRMLLAGGFKDLARAWLPPREQVPLLQDEALRNELAAFYATQEESESVRRAQVQTVWDENLRILTDPNPRLNDWERLKSSQALAKVIAQIPQSTIAPAVTELVKTNPDGAVRLLSGLGRKVDSERRGDVVTRLDNLKAQATLANLVAELVPPGQQPWSQLLDMMADFWISEAETTFTQKATPTGGQPKYVAPEELLPTAPAGKWAAALSPSLRDRVDASLSRAILAGTNFEQAADRIVEIGKRNAGAGVALAEDFLTIWAKTHNPQLPEPLRKKFDLPEDARIPVTPIMMEKNVEGLARMMALFRQAGIAPRDYEKVVSAFDLAYSSAEAYRASHIEQVFGPIAKMDEPLFFLILSRMNANLSERWRKMDVQRAGLTRRDETQTLDMVRAGYGTALQMIESWLSGHPEGTRGLTLAGTLLTDWGDFEYFQELAASDPQKRMAGYKEKNLQAQDYFQRGAEAYAQQVPKLTPADYSIDAYLGWFNGLLGIGSGGQVNLSKAMNRAALTRIREHLLALPGKAAKAHLSLFTKAVNARLADEKDPIHEDLRYRYLASSLVVSKDDPFSADAEKKVAYFDDLLRELRLQTRVDGASTIGRDQDFGIILSIIHTEAMGRVAKFGQYLMNDPAALPNQPNKQRKKSPLAKKMRNAQGSRDELELSLTEALSPFFDIRSITFSSPDVKPRPTAQTGWEETVLAYILVRAKDASVDRIPPVQMELKFIDLTGPVSIPAESAETVIRIATVPSPPRPASKVEITQTLDTRQFLINGALPLEIKATANGLVPELDQLLDLEALKKQIPVKSINVHDGLQVKELNTWGDEVAPNTERLWTVALDGDPIRAKGEPTAFQFPPPKAAGATSVYQTYREMNLTTLPEPRVTIESGTGAGGAATPASTSLLRRFAVPALVVALIAVGLVVFLTTRRTGPSDHQLARQAFHMPSEVDGFAIVALLRRLRSSPLVHLPETQRAELQQDLQRVQQSCFGGNGHSMSEADLRGIAEKWLRVAC